MKLMEEKKGKREQLPEDVILGDIFLKLSAKSVLRLKLVRKSWYFSIRNPKFIDRFLENSASRPDGTALLLSIHNERLQKQYLISTNTQELLDRPIELLSVLDTKRELLVSQNINGIFCIYPPSHLTFYESTASANGIYVFNPTTREVRSVPPLSNPPNKFLSGINSHLISYYFGFDPVNKQYKVVGICCNILVEGSLRVEVQAECGIFTLGERSWRNVKVPIPVSFKPSTPGVCVNGAIHWMIKERRLVLSFGLADEAFRLIQFDHGLDGDRDGDGDGEGDEVYYDDDEIVNESSEDKNSVWPSLIQVGSYLAVLEYDDDKLWMWVLKDYQNQQWVMQMMDYPYDWNLMHSMPYGSSHPGEFFLSLNHFTGSSLPKIVCCNMEHNTHRTIDFTEQSESFNSSALTMSLVGCYPENIMPLPKI